MVRPEFVVIGVQLVFSMKDLLGRYYMERLGFSLDALLHPWFVLYVVLNATAMIGQLYVLSEVELGKTMALFGATSIVIANVLGLALLGEVLSVREYSGVMIAILAYLVLALS